MMPKGVEHLGLDSRPSTKAFEGGLRGNDDQTLRRLIPPSAPSGFAFGDALDGEGGLRALVEGKQMLHPLSVGGEGGAAVEAVHGAV